MRRLRTRHLNRMAHFDHIEPMRIDRLGGHGARRPRPLERAASEPPGTATAEKRKDDRGRGKARPSAARAREVLEIEARRHRLRCPPHLAGAGWLSPRAP